METDNPSEHLQPFSFNAVTDKLKKIAEVELNEKESETQEALNSLKILLRKETDLNSCLDDAFLIMFLRARKFNCEASFNLVKKYYSTRIKYPSMFRNFTPKSCIKVLKSNLHYFLPYRSPDGCAILLSKFGLWDPKLITCEELLKFNLMCNEMAMQNPVTQICGVITIADMKDFSWSHLLQIPVADVKCFVSTLQDCLPVRNKAIHIINHSSIFSLLFAIVKPLLSEKVTKRIYFHGDDVRSLHQHLLPEILPKDLGGTLSSIPNEDFYNSLLNSDEIFISRQNYDFQRKILLCLGEIRREQNSFIRKVTSQWATKTLPLNCPKFPIHAPPGLAELNEYLENYENFVQTCTFFQSVGGITVNDTIRRILQSIMTNRLSTQYNWKGTGGVKLGFCKFVNIVKLVSTSVRQHSSFEKTTDLEIESFIKRWLMHAKDREGGRAHRRSKETK